MSNPSMKLFSLIFLLIFEIGRINVAKVSQLRGKMGRKFILLFCFFGLRVKNVA